jgi:hypothetical protein
MVHERPISVDGWKGSGYSIIDTDYGVGAYKISGGSNGGQVSSGQVDIVGTISMLLTILAEITKKASFSIADFFLNYMNTAVKCLAASFNQAMQGHIIIAIAIVVVFLIFLAFFAFDLIIFGVMAAQLASKIGRILSTIAGILLSYFGWSVAGAACDAVDPENNS